VYWAYHLNYNYYFMNLLQQYHNYFEASLFRHCSRYRSSFLEISFILVLKVVCLKLNQNGFVTASIEGLLCRFGGFECLLRTRKAPKWNIYWMLIMFAGFKLHYFRVRFSPFEISMFKELYPTAHPCTVDDPNQTSGNKSMLNEE